ncbi:MAG: FAD-dependent oxidoreductase [Candidatus Fermentibacteraceae bacterium]
MIEPKRVVILGGGPSGLWTALHLLRLHPGLGVTIIEREEFPGGIAGSFKAHGLTWDLGSHRLHPAASPGMIGDVRGLLGVNLLTRPRNGRILLEGRFLGFPLSPADMARHLPPSFAIGVVFDGLTAPFRRRPGAGATFGDVMMAGLGRTICRRFYFPYAEKLWGLAPNLLDGEQARRRVSAGTLGGMFKKLVPASRSGIDRRSFHYPLGGFGSIFTAAARNVESMGGKLLTGAVVRTVTPSTPGAAGLVEYTRGHEDAVLPADFVFSTIPVTDLVPALTVPVPGVVRAAASSLSYRCMVLCYVVLDSRQFSVYDAHYFPGPETRFSRMSERQNYDESRESPGSTGLCLEIPCFRTDPLWSMDDSEILGIALHGLNSSGLSVSGVKAFFTRRITEAYPSYPAGWHRHFGEVDRWLTQLTGLVTLGRQGLFVHDNTHHAMEMGALAARCFDPATGWDSGGWSEARKLFRKNVVED